MTTKIWRRMLTLALFPFCLCIMFFIGTGCGGGEQKSDAPATPPAQSPPTAPPAEPTPAPPAATSTPTQPTDTQPQSAAGTNGTISGRVKLTGEQPIPKKLKVAKETEICGTEKVEQTLMVGPDGGVQNAVVFLATAPQGVTPEPQTKTPVLDQKACEYIPHVLLVSAGIPFDIRNSDETLHNIHTYSEKNTPINRAQPKFKKVLRETFTQPEIIKVKCDVHDWMSAWVVVQGHPYYVQTDAAGTFTLANVPPGTYELKMWHETLGEKTQPITVQAGKTATIAFDLSR